MHRVIGVMIEEGDVGVKTPNFLKELFKELAQIKSMKSIIFDMKVAEVCMCLLCTTHTLCQPMRRWASCYHMQIPHEKFKLLDESKQSQAYAWFWEMRQDNVRMRISKFFALGVRLYSHTRFDTHWPIRSISFYKHSTHTHTHINSHAYTAAPRHRRRQWHVTFLQLLRFADHASLLGGCHMDCPQEQDEDACCRYLGPQGKQSDVYDGASDSRDASDHVCVSEKDRVFVCVKDEVGYTW